MELYIIFIQRKESYKGQYGIEAMEIMDEYSYADNPDFLNNKLKKYRTATDIDRAELITVTIDEEQVEKSLYPDRKIKGDIQ